MKRLMNVKTLTPAALMQHFTGHNQLQQMLQHTALAMALNHLHEQKHE
jgi:hypothetical protein